MTKLNHPVSGDTSPRGEQWHALAPDDVVVRLHTDPLHGLDPREAVARLERYGPNALPEPESRPVWHLVLAQLRSPLVFLLGIAAATSYLLGHRSDAVVIGVVVAINTVVGAVQEGRAEQSMAALRKLVSAQARVVRGGAQRQIDARELVPGDLVVVEAGDSVSADARVLTAVELRAAEAAITGESVPVDKSPEAVDANAPLGDHRGVLLAGTFVTSGRGTAVVVATGRSTEIGAIARLSESQHDARTPLELRIDTLGRRIMVWAVVVFVAIVAVGLWRGLSTAEIVLVAISQIVGLIPEGLPVAVTIALAVGVQRMSRRGAVIRRLAAVETLGSTTVVCTDKTGTLTRNEMTVQRLVLPDRIEVTVSGGGYGPDGEFAVWDEAIAPNRHPALLDLLEASVLCNDATVSGPHADGAVWRPIGDPTEAALVTVAIKAGVDVEALRAARPRVAEQPFEASTKRMVSVHALDGALLRVVKGAPDVVLPLCAEVGQPSMPLDADARRWFEERADQMGGDALRVLAVAAEQVVDDDIARTGSEPDPLATASSLVAPGPRLRLLGLVGQMDPPRPEVADAIADCTSAGIRTVMVTGDHQSTGAAIARALGIWRPGDRGMSGDELELLDDAALDGVIGSVAVFSRVRPAQKLHIVAALQRRGEVVAMTGDGVNDAPALVNADVGVAMGRSGTEVARDAARIVLNDDNFATIVAAVAEGRVAWQNIRKAALLLFSTSVAEVLILMVALLVGLPLPFVAVQILWNNLVTEGLVTINLAMEGAEGDEMRQRPTPRAAALVDREMLVRMALMAGVIVIVVISWFGLRLQSGAPEDVARTEAFTLLAVCEWYNVLNCLSSRRSALSFGVLTNHWLLAGLVVGNLLQVAVVFVPAMNRVFHTVPISLGSMVALGAVGSLVLWSEEARKLWVRRRARSGHRDALQRARST